MNITGDNNFCRVFELPTAYPEGYCFGGGKPVMMAMVDWFNPIPAEDIRNNAVKPWPDYVPLLREFLLQKNYVKPGRRYVLITDFGEALVFEKPIWKGDRL